MKIERTYRYHRPRILGIAAKRQSVVCTDHGLHFGGNLCNIPTYCIPVFYLPDPNIP